MQRIRLLLPGIFMLITFAANAQADNQPGALANADTNENAASEANPARLAQLIDYVGVDYAVAVADGEIISPAEYQEMQEFGRLIRSEITALENAEIRDRLRQPAESLLNQIEAKADPGVVASTTANMRSILLEAGVLNSTPRHVPQLAEARRLYAENCTACHGAEGQGDGPAAAGMEPAPTDFTDPERARQRTLYGLYNTISLGVEGTSMTAFPQLSDAQRWALAFYVGGLHTDSATLAGGEAGWNSLGSGNRPGLEEISTETLDAVAANQSAQMADIHAWLRANPQALASERPDPLGIAMTGVSNSRELYVAGEFDAAYSASVEAYLEGFELAEPALRAAHPDLVVDIEAAMADLRQRVKNRDGEDAVSAAADRSLELLASARDRLDSENVSSTVAFTSAFIILLREGLEAVLILGAIAAFLRKTNHAAAMPWLHAGWLAALAAGLATWIVSNYFVQISGATREVTEGVTALFAAAVLFYVGFWMHSKLNAARWQHFIQSKVQAALDDRALWTITLIAFVAVYREVFETVLFYQALWSQVAADGHTPIMGGFLAGSAAVLVSAWAIFRFGVRLPLKQFFGISAAIMIALAVIFAGKGIAALQEAGKLPIDPISFPRIELLGIYPNLQALGLQLLVIAAAIAFIVYNGRSGKDTSTA